MADQDPDQTEIQRLIAMHRKTGMDEYFAGHDAIAAEHFRAVDELQHIGDHYGRDLAAVLEQLANLQP